MRSHRGLWRGFDAENGQKNGTRLAKRVRTPKVVSWPGAFLPGDEKSDE